MAAQNTIDAMVWRVVYKLTETRNAYNVDMYHDVRSPRRLERVDQRALEALTTFIRKARNDVNRQHGNSVAVRRLPTSGAAHRTSTSVKALLRSVRGKRVAREAWICGGVAAKTLGAG